MREDREKRIIKKGSYMNLEIIPKHTARFLIFYLITDKNVKY